MGGDGPLQTWKFPVWNSWTTRGQVTILGPSCRLRAREAALMNTTGTGAPVRQGPARYGLGGRVGMAVLAMALCLGSTATPADSTPSAGAAFAKRATATAPNILLI